MGAPAPAAGGGAGRGRRTAPCGTPGWWVVAESGNLPCGGRRTPSPGRSGREDPPGSAPFRQHPGGRLSSSRAVSQPAARPSPRSGGWAPAAVDTHFARPEKPACWPRVSGNRFCCCVILYQPLLFLLPAAPFFLRPFVSYLLRACPFSSRSPPAKCQYSRGARGKGAGRDLGWSSNGKHQAERGWTGLEVGK